LRTASHGPAVRSLARPSGVQASHMNTPGPRNRAEYFESAASPAAAPAAIHHAAPPRRRAFSALHRVRIQNRLAGASGTARKPPAVTSGMALNQTPARRAVRSSAPANRARSKTSRPPAAAARIAGSLTPRAVSPATARPSQIHQEIIG